MSECIFCKILSGDIPSSKVFENENVFAFKDLYPMAKKHYLFISKNHSNNLNEMENSEIINVMNAIKEFTQKEKLIDSGYRVVTNIGKEGGQSVFHTHFHVLAGEQLRGFGA